MTDTYSGAFPAVAVPAIVRGFIDKARQTTAITDTGDQNDYAPGGATLWKTTWWVRLNAGSGGDYDITGFDADGRNDDDFVYVKFVQNIASNKTITLKNLDVLSDLENRIEMPDAEDLVMGPGALVVLVYSLEDTVWRPMNFGSSWLSNWPFAGTFLVKNATGNVVPVGSNNEIAARVDTSPGTGLKTYTREYVEHILRAGGIFTDSTASGTDASFGGNNWKLAWHQRFQPTGDLTIQSFVASPNDVQFTFVKLIVNDGTGRLILEHEATGETAADRIKCPRAEDFILESGDSVFLAYSNSELRWLPVAARGPSIKVNLQTGTTYTLLDSDDGKVVKCSNASSIAVTVPDGLRTGFACLIAQGLAGQVTLSGAATLEAPDSALTTRVQYSQLSVSYIGVADTYIVGGDQVA